MTNLTDHQYAEDGRIPFAFGGSGSGRIHCASTWGTANLTVNSQHRLFKALKACYVSNFAFTSSDMDTHATPLLKWDIGTADDDDEFVSDATVGQTGDVTLTNVVDESTVAGFELAAGDYIILSVSAAPATAAAGTTLVSFDCATL